MNVEELTNELQKIMDKSQSLNEDIKRLAVLLPSIEKSVLLEAGMIKEDFWEHVAGNDVKISILLHTISKELNPQLMLVSELDDEQLKRHVEACHESKRKDELKELARLKDKYEDGGPSGLDTGKVVEDNFLPSPSELKDGMMIDGKKRKIGRFRISGMLLKVCNEAVPLIIGRCILLASEYRHDIDCFEYVAFSEDFDLLGDDEEIPEYSWDFTKEGEEVGVSVKRFDKIMIPYTI